MRRASIDIGSNTVLLLIGDVGEKYTELANETRITSLGKNLDKTSEFIQEAMDDTFQALSDYKEIIESFDLKVSEAIVTATEASRVAKNSPAFFNKIKKELGFNIQTITPEGEAFYVARGVCGAGNLGERNELVIMDIGGASTEFMKIRVEPFEVISMISLPFGSVRGTDWINEGIFDEKMDYILKNSNVHEYKTDFLLCVAGSMTSLAGMIKGLPKYDSSKINGAAITYDTFKKFASKIVKLTPSTLLGKFPFLGKRSKTIVAGARLGLKVGDYLNIKTFEISTLGLRYGTLFEGRIDERFTV